MAIKFFRFKRKINNNGVVVEKYMAQMQVETVIGFEEIAEKIEKDSSLTKGDLINSFYQMTSVAEDFLLNGHEVNFGPFGSFYPSMQATACDTPEEVTSKTIKKFHPIFKPSKELKKKFKEAVFHLGDNKVRGVKYKKKD